MEGIRDLLEVCAALALLVRSLSWVDLTPLHHRQTGSVGLTQFFYLLMGLRKLRRLNQSTILHTPHTERNFTYDCKLYTWGYTEKLSGFQTLISRTTEYND